MARADGVTPAAARLRAKAIAIRRAALDDLDAVETLEQAVFQSDELSRRSLRYYIGASTAAFIVADEGHSIVGDAIVAFRRGSTLARLYSIAVDPAASGKGLGRMLLAHCEAVAAARGATRLRLEVRADNAPAIKLYRNAGYAEFGRYPDYYEDGTAALRFEKTLDAEGSGLALPARQRMGT